MNLQASPISDPSEWSTIIQTLSGHPLQDYGWGALKESSGHWTAHRVVIRRQDGTTAGAAQILTRTLPWPLRALHYVPRGPALAAGTDRGEALTVLANWTQKNLGGIMLKVEPEWDADSLPANGRIGAARPSADTILINHTLMIDLTQSEDELLADLSRTTRQNVRRMFKGTFTAREVTSTNDLEKCLDIYERTAERADFGIHTREYYRDAFSVLGGTSKVFAAYEDDQPICFVWLAANSTEAFELWAGMNERGQKLRANYGLKWYAMMSYRELGLRTYDLNGLLNDGISSFKRGFAKHENELVPTLDIPFGRGVGYWVWVKASPWARSCVKWVTSKLHR